MTTRRLVITADLASGIPALRKSGRLPLVFRQPRQHLFTGLRQRTQRSLAVPGAFDDPPSDQLANPVLLAIRPSLTDTFQRHIHVRQRSRIKAIRSHRELRLSVECPLSFTRKQVPTRVPTCGKRATIRWFHALEPFGPRGSIRTCDEAALGPARRRFRQNTLSELGQQTVCPASEDAIDADAATSIPWSFSARQVATSAPTDTYFVGWTS
jgi:hypothetical protein